MSPYIIEQNQEKRKKQEPHVTHSGIMGIRNPSQPQTTNEKTVRILEYTRDMSNASFINAIAKMMVSRANIDYKKDIIPRIAEIKQAELDKERRRLEDIQKEEERRSTQPFAIFEDFYSATRGGHKEEISKYSTWQVKDLALLLDKVNAYDPPRLHHRQIKREVVAYIRNTIIRKQAQPEPQPSKSLKIGRIGKFLKRK